MSNRKLSEEEIRKGEELIERLKNKTKDFVETKGLRSRTGVQPVFDEAYYQAIEYLNR